MKNLTLKISTALFLFSLLSSELAAANRGGNIGKACRREKSCFMALDGTQRGLCQAYMEGRSCFMSLNGNDRGWCQVIKEGKSCFMALDRPAREDCEDGFRPGRHLFWIDCARRN